ncbi:MAG: hypothetical protein GX434_16245 [Peptococcaceae bacterium]|nr:hypothetical protein [Peptococcaceae bacterium]
MIDGKICAKVNLVPMLILCVDLMYFLMRAGDFMRKSQAIAGTAAFLILILLGLLTAVMLTGRMEQETPEASAGYVDLSGFDFQTKLAYIPHSDFLYYREALYTPSDFLSGRANQEPEALTSVTARFDPGRFGTYRLVLTLPDNMTCGLSSYSAMYTQRLFINGNEYPAFGVTGKTPETTVPQTKHYTVYFAPVAGKAEIIIQFANFDHYDFGGIVPLYMGAQDKIALRDALAQQRIHLLVGCVLTAFLFFFGMFLFFHRRYAFVWFALSCLAIAVRMLIVEEKVIMIMLPDLPWKLSIGLEYMSLIVLVLAFLQYIYHMFQGALYKPVLWANGALCALFASAVLFTPPIVYTRFMPWFQYGAVMFGVYVAVALACNVVRKKDNRHTEHVLIFIGTLIFIVLSVINVQTHRAGGYSRALGLSETGMLVMIFANMVALTLQFARTEAELDKARQSEREMQQTNELLDSMSRLKSDFLANISHEMRTPLTVMASYAGLTSLQIERNAVSGKTLDNLATIKREAIRLAGMVEQIKDVSLEKERRLTLVEIDAGSLLRQAAKFCEPICLKNKNRLDVSLDSGENPLLFVNAESIFQTLVNLIINANRHTKEGVIRLNVLEENPGSPSSSGFVTIAVADDGDGIEPALKPHIFERGFSGDGSSGLGLAICKEIIEEHGGEIRLESEHGKGTIIYFTLPRRKETENHE